MNTQNRKYSNNPHQTLRNDSDISKTLTDNVHYVTVELPKFKKGVSDLSSLADRMIWLLRNMGSLKSVPEEFHNKGLEKLFDISNFTAMTYEEQMGFIVSYSILSKDS